MVKPQLLEERPISLAELKEKLTKIKEKDKELNFRANKTEEYLASIQVLSAKEAKELEKKLVALDIPRLKQDHIVKIIDILPRTVNELKVVLQGTLLSLSADNLKKVVDAVNEFKQ
ncbi:hypothetical protein HY639_03670 [Candidatus Woesearchaeota archaeon]|nr:hypothetical protein [Candidatus Woesearchaeota archaeon]